MELSDPAAEQQPFNSANLPYTSTGVKCSWSLQYTIENFRSSLFVSVHTLYFKIDLSQLYCNCIESIEGYLSIRKLQFLESIK